jgi:molybdenum cofactor biosynthesis enzyme
MPQRTWPTLLVLAVLLASGCGSSSGSSSTPGATAAAGTGGATEGAGALAADAKSAATGDIPDTQNFLTLHALALHVSMLYPEGWTVQESPSRVSISEKNNLVRIALAGGAAPSTASVQAQLATLARSTPGLTVGKVATIALAGGPAVKATYTTLSAPNPVTGKQVTLTVDRYELARGGRVATIDLGTPVGVDNVDAYRKMIESFKWQ